MWDLSLCDCSSKILVVMFHKIFPTLQVLSVIAMLSGESIYVNPSGKKEMAANVRRKFLSVEGDHVTMLKIFRAFRGSKENKVRKEYSVLLC